MATSGSSNYNDTFTDIVTDAFEIIGVAGLGQTLAPEDEAKGFRHLNRMLKRWSKQGLHLWAKEEGILYFTQYSGEYKLGNASTDSYATLASDQVVTQLNGALAVSATAVTVDSTTGMTVGDYIGVVTSTNALYWTTIATIPTSTTLTLTVGITSAASDNALVYTFTNRITKPARVISCRKVSGVDSGATSTISEILMSPMSYSDYMESPNKTNNGTPTQYMYDPKLTNGKFYTWVRPNNCSQRIHFTFERMLEDVDTATDNMDLPQEWLEPITWQLAMRLGVVYGKKQRVAEILPIASNMLEDALAGDQELASMFLQPDTNYGEK